MYYSSWLGRRIAYISSRDYVDKLDIIFNCIWPFQNTVHAVISDQEVLRQRATLSFKKSDNDHAQSKVIFQVLCKMEF